MVPLILGGLLALALFLGFMDSIDWAWGTVLFVLLLVAVMIGVMVLILQGLYELGWCSAASCQVWGSRWR